MINSNKWRSPIAFDTDNEDVSVETEGNTPSAAITATPPAREELLAIEPGVLNELIRDMKRLALDSPLPLTDEYERGKKQPDQHETNIESSCDTSVPDDSHSSSGQGFHYDINELTTILMSLNRIISKHENRTEQQSSPKAAANEKENKAKEMQDFEVCYRDVEYVSKKERKISRSVKKGLSKEEQATNDAANLIWVKSGRKSSQPAFVVNSGTKRYDLHGKPLVHIVWSFSETADWVNAAKVDWSDGKENVATNMFDKQNRIFYGMDSDEEDSEDKEDTNYNCKTVAEVATTAGDTYVMPIDLTLASSDDEA